MASRFVAYAVVASAFGLVTSQAAGYCRTNTCDADPEDPACSSTADGCLRGGEALFWNRSCLSFSVNANGSPKRGISYDEASKTISDAMYRWIDVECAKGGTPAMALELYPEVTCNEIQFNRKGPNANSWVFRDDEWPYDSVDAAMTLALTTVTFNARTGEILDADVEINSAGNELTAEDQSDLAAVATHEAGHVFGLAHSRDSESTMWAYYSAGMADGVSLGPDDASGICAAYPPDSANGTCNFAPEGGFVAGCYSPKDSGCSLASPVASSGRSAVGLLTLLAFAGWIRRRRS